MLAFDSLTLPRDQPGYVAEIQGAEGTYSFSELILQKIWMRREFDHASAVTTDGRVLTLQHPGRWNRAAGPDFRCARFHLEDRSFAGDVEVHLNATDWDSHGHAADPEYDRVALHVVLFPPHSGYRTLGANGQEIPTLSLLSLLPRDIESFALDDAAENLAGLPAVRLFEGLSSMPAERIRCILHDHALRRWEEKIHFARFRIERLGWENACHHAALECLGYSGNRVPMLRVASRWPLGMWSVGEISAQRAWTETKGIWRLRCGRPANHPMHRLSQYSDWVRAVPDWPGRLTSIHFPVCPSEVPIATREARRTMSMSAFRKQIATDILASNVGGTRLDTLVCDAFFPLLAARGLSYPKEYWLNWFVGDAPDSIRAAMRDAASVDSRVFGNCNGLAQGLLAWCNTQLLSQSGKP